MKYETKLSCLLQYFIVVFLCVMIAYNLVCACNKNDTLFRILYILFALLSFFFVIYLFCVFVFYKIIKQ